MPRSPWCRLLLQSEAGRRQLRQIVTRESWLMDRVVQRSEDHPFELVYITPDETVTIHYVEDFVLDMRYVLVQGLGHGRILEIVRADVEVVPREEVLERAAEGKDGQDLVVAVYAVAASACSTYDAELFAVVERAARSDATIARRAAAVSIGYLEWQESRFLLEHLANDDPDPLVAETAKRVLEALTPMWKA